MMRQVIPRLCRQARASYAPFGCREFSRGYRRPLWPSMIDRQRPAIWDIFHGDHWGWPGRMMQENANTMRRMFDEMNNPRFFGPLHNYARVSEADRVQVEFDNKIFRIKLDMSDYSTDEISVKIVDDKIVLTAKREQTADDYGFHSREMTRHFLIPENVDRESIKCTQTPEQELIITGRVEGSENVKERVLNIEKEDATEKNDKKD